MLKVCCPHCSIEISSIEFEIGGFAQGFKRLSVRQDGEYEVYYQDCNKRGAGYGPADEAYNDKVTITPTSISYEYKPMYESELNPSRKWSYKTNSPIFRMMYDKVAGMLTAIIERGIQEFCTDIGGIEFTITYSDKTKFKEIYWVTGDYFKEFFVAIMRMVPETEYTPVVLLTSEDFEDDEDEG